MICSLFLPIHYSFFSRMRVLSSSRLSILDYAIQRYTTNANACSPKMLSPISTIITWLLKNNLDEPPADNIKSRSFLITCSTIQTVHSSTILWVAAHMLSSSGNQAHGFFVLYSHQKYGTLSWLRWEECTLQSCMSVIATSVVDRGVTYNEGRQQNRCHDSRHGADQGHHTYMPPHPTCISSPRWPSLVPRLGCFPEKRIESR